MIGIIGGGQLGRMLALAAARFGYRVTVLEPGADCPAAQVANRHLVAPYDDPGALTELARTCAVVTYEFENVPLDAAELLAARVPLRPGPHPLRVSQDRLVEKEFLTSIGLPTAPFAPIDGEEGVAGALSLVGTPAMVKTRRFGYDGKGQRRIDGSPPPDLFAQLGGAPLIAEGFVPFTCEISVIAARSTAGDVQCFEPAANEHRHGILSRSVVPAGVAPGTRSAAIDAARRLIEALDHVGVLGLELFVLPDGTIVANEFAPRVHNSGHWTELACLTDQFEQHIRAVAGLPLGDPTGRPCQMLNLIGDDVDRWLELVAEPGWRVHLYGKAEVRPGRKLGHATRLT